MRFKDAKQFTRSIRTAAGRLEREVNLARRRLARRILERVILETPQWSGMLVSNWNIAYGEPDMTVTTELTTQEKFEQGALFIKGNVPMMEEALQRATPVLRKIPKTGETIYITNPTPVMGGFDYKIAVEENRNNFLRGPNEPGHMLRDAMRAEYDNLVPQSINLWADQGNLSVEIGTEEI